MREFATSYRLVLYAALIVVTMAVLDWRESRRSHRARARRQRCEQRQTMSAVTPHDPVRDRKAA